MLKNIASDASAPLEAGRVRLTRIALTLLLAGIYMYTYTI